MKSALKIVSLRMARRLGLFHLSEILTAKWLRILCYHGASWDDEHLFRPTLFIAPVVFGQRMSWLKSRGFAVLSLGDALQLRRERRLPRRATVITIDDGWSGSREFMFPVLREHGFPATLYVATRPLEEAGPIFDVFLPYVLWRARDRQIDLATIDPRLAGQYRLESPAERNAVAARFADLCRGPDAEAVRRELAARLVAWLGNVQRGFLKERVIELMTMSELAQARDYNVEIQLHTHTHRMPGDNVDDIRAEIDANRAALAPIATTELTHFCYPGNRRDPQVLPVLAALGIESAMTCDPGFVDARTADLLLPRFLDADDLDPIVFEAEMSGILEIGRRVGRALRLNHTAAGAT